MTKHGPMRRNPRLVSVFLQVQLTDPKRRTEFLTEVQELLQGLASKYGATGRVRRKDCYRLLLACYQILIAPLAKDSTRGFNLSELPRPQCPFR